MDLGAYQDFFITCAGASASFIGLLFVALSVVLARNDANGNGDANNLHSGKVELEFTDRRLAESAFTALVNIFFISLIAIMPIGNIGYVALPMAIIGVISSYRLFLRFKEYRKKDSRASYERSDLVWLILSLLVYVVQGIYAIRMLIDPTNTADLTVMVSILLTLFALGLVRSWELTGIRTR